MRENRRQGRLPGFVMLEHAHNSTLVVASFAIAVISGFTGLSLTQGASGMSVPRRKLMVAMSAVALGGGIWSMHFVAMLGLRLPVPFYYDALVTMISALIAILVTGAALLLVHFGERTGSRIALGGLCLAAGIVSMHYIGMSGIEAVRPVYATGGIAVAVAAAAVLCVAAFCISYGARTPARLLVGTLAFAIAVFSVHFIAMAGTDFIALNQAEHSGVWLGNDILAFGVTLTAFVISGAFLLVSVSFAGQGGAGEAGSEGKPAASQPAQPAKSSVGRIPFEKNGRIHFLDADSVAAIRAEGRYTFVYHETGRLFSPWSISEAEDRTAEAGFLRCHRSYLVNPKFVTGFERRKDNGICFFDGAQQIEKVPVSRSYLKAVRTGLGL